MSNRIKLGDIFKGILDSKDPKDSRVYFQPPPSVRMSYPAIRYEIASIRPKHADNILYLHKTAYTVMLIDPNPDNIYFDKLLNLPYCSLDRVYTADNLNHYVFTIFY